MNTRINDGSAGVAPTQEPQRASWAEQDPLLTSYYDEEWGMPVFDEAGVFERLTLESFQSGLSWLTVLRKREAFREAFDSFEVDRVAAYCERDIERLLSDERIIRNRRKIVAAISNAQAAQRLREEHTDLAEFVWSFMPLASPVPRTEDEVPAASATSAALAKALKLRGFTFVGPTTMFALMAAIGIVEAHTVTSPRLGCSGLWSADGTRSAEADLTLEAAFSREGLSTARLG